MLHLSRGLASPWDLGEVRLELAFCLLLSWLVVLCCLARGVRSSGKVVYLTATLPYIVLLVLLVMTVSLPGASLGLKYLFVPEWHKLKDFQVRKFCLQLDCIIRFPL